MSTPDDIQAEIEHKRQIMRESQIRRRIYLILAATHAAAFLFPGWIFLVCGFAWSLLLYVEYLGMGRELAGLYKKRRDLDEQIDTFVEERGDAIRRRMQAMLETEARERARRQNSPSMFKGNCVDVTPE